MANIYSPIPVEFGCSASFGGFTGSLVQNLEVKRASEQVEAMNEVGSVVAVAVIDTLKSTITGDYLYAGDSTSIGDVIPFNALGLSGSILITENSEKVGAKEFRTGNFSAIHVTGIDFNSGSIA